MEKTLSSKNTSKSNEMTIYGIRPVMEAIKSGKEIDKILDFFVASDIHGILLSTVYTLERLVIFDSQESEI